MARSGVTREQVFETADALVREGQNPTVVAVRTRLGGGSPNTITPLLAEWKALHDTQQAASIPSPPEPVEAVLRQVWGTAWQQAQSQLDGERAALATARKEIETEREAMLSEINRLDSELEAALEEVGKGRAALETERHAHEQARSDAREAKAVAAEREKRLSAQESDLQDLRRQLEEARSHSARLETERDHARKDLEDLRAAQAAEQETGKRLSAELQDTRRRAEAAEMQAASAAERAAELEQGMEQERAAHEKTRTALNEARAALTERTERLQAQAAEMQTVRSQLGYLRPTPQNGQDCALRALYPFDISTVSKIANRLCLSASMHVGCAVSN